MFQDIRYPYMGETDSESLHKFSECLFDRLCKDYEMKTPHQGRKFIYSLDPTQLVSSQPSIVLRTDVFNEIVPGGTSVNLPKIDETTLLYGIVSPIFKTHRARKNPLLEWFQSRELITNSGNIEELRVLDSSRRKRKIHSQAYIPETIVVFTMKISNLESLYQLLRNGIGDNRAYGCGVLFTQGVNVS